jgi:hypothetical protein
MTVLISITITITITIFITIEQKNIKIKFIYEEIINTTIINRFKKGL